MSLKISKLQTADETVSRFMLEGRLDGTTATELESTLRESLSSRTNSLIFHMGGLDFISSAGIRVLIETQKTMSERGGSVLLVDLQPQIRKVLEIIQALPGINVFRDAQEMDQYLAAIQRKVKEEKK